MDFNLFNLFWSFLAFFIKNEQKKCQKTSVLVNYVEDDPFL